MPEESKKSGKPYAPKHPGFDVEQTERAQKTADRAREGASGSGADADWSYAEDGPKEAARRLGTSEKDVGERIERANDAAKKS